MRYRRPIGREEILQEAKYELERPLGTPSIHPLLIFNQSGFSDGRESPGSVPD
jgi:hypothetical protein